MNKINTSNAWVFISHSNKDYDKIQQVKNKLEALQYKPKLFSMKCLYDDSEIFELIKREIKARDRFILCDSKNYRESEWLQREREFIISLNRPYEVINIDGSDEEIDERINLFNQRSTIYIWSTDDRINDVVVEKFVDKAYRVELLPYYYLKDYYYYKTVCPDLVHEDFHNVMDNEYVLFLISRELSEKEADYIDSIFRIYMKNCRIYVTANEAHANWTLYKKIRKTGGVLTIDVCNNTLLADRSDYEVADKIVANLMELDNYKYNKIPTK